MFRFLQALAESWQESRDEANTRKLASIETDLKIEQMYSSLTETRIAEIRAETELTTQKAGYISAQAEKESPNGNNGRTKEGEGKS